MSKFKGFINRMKQMFRKTDDYQPTEADLVERQVRKLRRKMGRHFVRRFIEQ